MAAAAERKMQHGKWICFDCGHEYEGNDVDDDDDCPECGCEVAIRPWVYDEPDKELSNEETSTD